MVVATIAFAETENVKDDKICFVCTLWTFSGVRTANPSTAVTHMSYLFWSFQQKVAGLLVNIYKLPDFVKFTSHFKTISYKRD